MSRMDATSMVKPAGASSTAARSRAALSEPRRSAPEIPMMVAIVPLPSSCRSLSLLGTGAAPVKLLDERARCLAAPSGRDELAELGHADRRQPYQHRGVAVVMRLGEELLLVAGE